MELYMYSLLALLGIIVVFFIIKKNRFLRQIKMDIGLGAIVYGGLIAIYALILAFVVIVVWQQYQSTGDKIGVESSRLYSVYHSTYGYKDSTNKVVAKKLRKDIKDYVMSVQKDEWPLMAMDSSSPVTQMIYDSIMRRVNQINPVTEGEKVWYATTIHDLNQFCDARHSRLADKDYNIPMIMWWMLFVGAGLIILLTIFLEAKNTSHHLLKVLMMSVMIIFSMMLIDMLDHPFQGSLGLDPTAFHDMFQSSW